MRRTSAVRVLALRVGHRKKKDTSPLCRNAQPIIFFSKVLSIERVCPEKNLGNMGLFAFTRPIRMLPAS